MVTFVAGLAIVLTALSALVFLAIIILVCYGTIDNLRRIYRQNEVLPPPDKAAERTYGQQYFDRAVSKD